MGERKLGIAQARRVKVASSLLGRSRTAGLAKGSGRGRREVVGASRARAWAWGARSSVFCLPGITGASGLALPQWLPFESARPDPDS